ncbi:uncharacterized protein LOC131396494 isoform X2 [Diceros bicornis minor]|uniref:uncharacterized protein LOC131396494 isoform X2 n=1 Tax=Diceros bicornis minor TaxID=77932 RepID=UPI0026F20BFE|nr:uncharacterized protein LOC131396494 isoform X2 [Diceros bicornis minor]
MRSSAAASDSSTWHPGQLLPWPSGASLTSGRTERGSEMPGPQELRTCGTAKPGAWREPCEPSLRHPPPASRGTRGRRGHAPRLRHRGPPGPSTSMPFPMPTPGAHAQRNKTVEVLLHSESSLALCR